MGLFAKENESASSVSEMKPIIVRTGNVAKELLHVASNAKIPVQSLDFKLLDTQTFSRFNGEAGLKDWIELTADEVKDITEEHFLNPKFELKQTYEIEIFVISELSPLDSIEMSIGGNSTLCKIYLTIKAGSIVRYYESFEQDFLVAVNKKKLRANLMIGLFDSVMPKNLGELIAKIRIAGEYTFQVQERYLIAQSYEPIPTTNDKLILHFEVKRQNQDENGRIDYAKRGYLISAVESELLIEYIKPLKGGDGRSCRGDFIASKEPIVRYEPTFTTGEKITVIDTPTTIEYRAKSGGYVTYKGGMYDIRTEMDVTEISFKTTGSIDSQMDADVSINVKEKDPFKDAIGIGMEVTVNVINVGGNVGANAKVTAKKASIDGQVHQSAVIRADELKINILKGEAYGKNIQITRLEQGSIEAEKVSVQQATGGKIRAKYITVETLGSHVKMTASHTIEMHHLIGGENQFIIDPLLNESRESLVEQTKKITEVKTAVHSIQKELEGYEKTDLENGPAMEELKRKLAHYKSNGITLPVAFVQKYRQFQDFKQKLESLRSELKEKEDQLERLSSQMSALQSDIFEARIINHDRWKNHNEIIFKLIDPDIEVVYVPAENSDEKFLGLHKDEDGSFSIKVLNK
jgi:chaperonin cofactor prefoldin